MLSDLNTVAFNKFNLKKKSDKIQVTGNLKIE